MKNYIPKEVDIICGEFTIYNYYNSLHVGMYCDGKIIECTPKHQYRESTLKEFMLKKSIMRFPKKYYLSKDGLKETFINLTNKSFN